MGIPKFVVLLLLVVLNESIAMLQASKTNNYQERIRTQCRFTRYPGLCLRTLLDLKDEPDHFMSALLNKTISETKLPGSYFDTATDKLEYVDALRYQSATDHCTSLMEMSLKRLEKSLLALKASPTKNKQDIQTWVSAALTFNDACKDSTDTLGELTVQISNKMDYLSQLGSNLLALVNRVNGQNSPDQFKPKKVTKHNRQVNFPGWVSVRDRKLLQTSAIEPDAVVAKDGTGNYETISEAIKAASGNRFVIYVKEGVYKEKIHTNKDGITLLGDGKYSTIITGDDSVKGGSSMPGSATLKEEIAKLINLLAIRKALLILQNSPFDNFAFPTAVTGDGFIARDIGFQNTAGPQGEQALALYIASDHSVLYRCAIIGYQDTIYALALRQFYRECDIYGTIDFIFGNAAAVFQNCHMVLRRPQHGSNYNVITAQGRTDPGQNTGFSIQNCRIAAGSDYSPVKHSVASYLGRPWKQYSRVVVMESYIDDCINSRGWVEWPGQGSYAKTLYFAEYANTGPGAGTSQRVNWPGVRVIEPKEAIKFTVGNFISGTSWLPPTGVTFYSGLQ